MPTKNSHYLTGHADLPLLYVYRGNNRWDCASAHRDSDGNMPSEWEWNGTGVTPIVVPSFKTTEDVTPSQAAAILGSLKGLQIDEMPF